MGGGPSARGPALSVLVLAALSACAPAGPFLAPPDAQGGGHGGGTAALDAQPRLARSRGLPVAEATGSGEELAFVSSILAELQLRSFAANREYCGYVGLDRAGRYVRTPAAEGSEASCPLPFVPPGMTLVASFHTHSTYSPWYASEWPTTQDVATDASDDIDGYISTPGGRLWHVDTDTMTVTQVCGRGCLPQDPRYVAADDGPLRRAMTYADLAAWERS